MGAVPPPPPPPPPKPPSSSSSQNPSENNNNESENDADDKNENPSSSTEFLFSQEVLRRRLSELSNKQSSSKSSSRDAVLDLSVVADPDNELRDSGISDEEASDFINRYETLNHIWVILFTNSTDGTEGVYSLSIGNDNIVLAFQERSEAHRYSVILEAQKFPQPQICEMDPRELREFCADSGLKLGFIPKGMVITPPEESAVDDLDKWRGNATNDGEGSTGMSDEDIDAMRKHFDSLFGQ